MPEQKTIEQRAQEIVDSLATTCAPFGDDNRVSGTRGQLRAAALKVLRELKAEEREHLAKLADAALVGKHTLIMIPPQPRWVYKSDLAKLIRTREEDGDGAATTPEGGEDGR